MSAPGDTKQAPRPIRVPEQIALYHGDLLLTHEVCRFDVRRAVSALHGMSRIMAIDIGGDKLRKATYAFPDGTLQPRDEVVLQAKGGAGYLAFLKDLAAEAERNNLRVGISSATKLEGSVITRTVNLSVFLDEFRSAYGADYANLFPGRSFVANDTITGICGASTLLALAGNPMRNVAFFICASGLGASVIEDGMAIHVEAAHVPVVSSLNPLGQVTPCAVEGRTFVCVERVAAIRAGIEDVYRQRAGIARDGVALGRLYEAGDRLATDLFETSALVLSHAIAGVLERYGFLTSRDTGVILHGGSFEVSRYREQVLVDLAALLPDPFPQVVFSRDLSSNPCLDGAAVLAACFAGND